MCMCVCVCPRVCTIAIGAWLEGTDFATAVGKLDAKALLQVTE